MKEHEQLKAPWENHLKQQVDLGGFRFVIGVPPVIIHSNDIFHYKYYQFEGTPGTPHLWTAAFHDFHRALFFPWLMIADSITKATLKRWEEHQTPSKQRKLFVDRANVINNEVHSTIARDLWKKIFMRIEGEIDASCNYNLFQWKRKICVSHPIISTPLDSHKR